ncbi:hypothetical protein [Nannocystis exedens]|uniref:hypothetical protein n=1 Tax=Nannocystis exedens TaxID=54 RepID=UPI00118129B4|nr:hypothetical protein [Nannocystis exedens]
MLACRPQPADSSEPRSPPPLFVATPDRLYTTAPLTDGLAYVPVAEKSIARRPGQVAVAISYPEIDLPDDDRERELAALIREAAMLDAWTDERLEGKVGTVEVTCVTPLATTQVVSLVCERIDATVDPKAVDPQAAAPELVARTFAVDGAHVVALTWADVLLPAVSPRLVVMAALDGHDARDAWLSGQCAAGEPGFSVFASGLDIWPDRRTPECPQLTLDRQRIAPFVVPNGLLARIFRLAGGPAEPAEAPPPNRPPKPPPSQRPEPREPPRSTPRPPRVGHFHEPSRTTPTFATAPPAPLDSAFPTSLAPRRPAPPLTPRPLDSTLPHQPSPLRRPALRSPCDRPARLGFPSSLLRATPTRAGTPAAPTCASAHAARREPAVPPRASLHHADLRSQGPPASPLWPPAPSLAPRLSESTTPRPGPTSAPARPGAKASRADARAIVLARARANAHPVRP